MVTSTPKVLVNEDWCKGCYICIDVCPTKSLNRSQTTNKKGIYTVFLEKEDSCTRCGLCQLGCPDFALTVNRKGKEV